MRHNLPNFFRKVKFWKLLAVYGTCTMLYVTYLQIKNRHVRAGSKYGL